MSFVIPATRSHHKDAVDIFRILSRLCFARGYAILFIAVLILGALLGV